MTTGATRVSPDEILCWGPAAKLQQSLVLVDEWIPSSRPREREEALREFAIRYFRGHGPATVRDFAWWTKLTLTDARAAVAAAGAELTELECDGVGYLVTTSQLDAAAPPLSRGVDLLPGFDEFLLGYADRSLTLRAEYADRIVPGGNGIFLPIIVAKGRVIGTWRRIPKPNAGLEADYFEKVPKATGVAFASAARRHARFMSS